MTMARGGDDDDDRATPVSDAPAIATATEPVRSSVATSVAPRGPRRWPWIAAAIASVAIIGGLVIALIAGGGASSSGPALVDVDLGAMTIGLPPPGPTQRQSIGYAYGRVDAIGAASTPNVSVIWTPGTTMTRAELDAIVKHSVSAMGVRGAALAWFVGDASLAADAIDAAGLPVLFGARCK